MLVRLPELLLDRLQLLAEEELALALLDLARDLRLDLRAELRHLHLASEDLRDPVQALLDVRRLEQLLPLLGLEPERRRDQERQRGRVVDVGGGEPQLLGQVRRHPDDLGELLLHRAGQRLDLRCLADDLRQVLDLGGQVGIVRDRLDEADALHPLDQDPQRPVGHLDHLVDDGDRADLVEVVPAGRLGLRVLDREEREHPLARDDVVDQLDRALLADRERRHRLGEDDGLLQRQDRQAHALGGGLAHVALRTTMTTAAPAGARSTTGRVTRGACPPRRRRSQPRRRCPARAGSALEPAVLDLGLLVDLPRHPRSRRLPEIVRARCSTASSIEPRVHPCQLDDDDELRGVVGGEAVDGRPEAVPGPREAGHLPEVGEELLDLPLQAVDVAPRH